MTFLTEKANSKSLKTFLSAYLPFIFIIMYTLYTFIYTYWYFMVVVVKVVVSEWLDYLLYDLWARKYPYLYFANDQIPLNLWVWDVFSAHKTTTEYFQKSCPCKASVLFNVYLTFSLQETCCDRVTLYYFVFHYHT